MKEEAFFGSRQYILDDLCALVTECIELTDTVEQSKLLCSH